MSAAEVEYAILGPLQATARGEQLPLGGRAQRALLAALLLNANEVVSVDRLVEAIWGHEPPATAAHAIEVHVSKLRRALGGEAIERGPSGYVLRVAPDRLDLGRFEALLGRARHEIAAGNPTEAADLLQDALALWRGRALADFEFDEFAQTAVTRLEELRLTAVKARAEADLALGRHEQIVPELRALTVDNPYDEKLCSLLMLALYRGGRQADALTTYQDARQRLHEDLGLEPSPVLRRLQRRMLAQDMSLDPPDAQPVRSVVVVPSDRGQLDELAALVQPLGKSKNAHEVIFAWLEKPAPSNAADALSAASSDLGRIQALLAEQGVEVRTAAFTAHDRADDVLRLAGQPEVDLLLLGADTSELYGGRLGPELSRILTAAPCDAALWAGRGDARFQGNGPIFVPFGAHDHDWAALELAAWLASADGKPVVLLGAAASLGKPPRDASRMLADAGLLIQRAAGVSVQPRLVEPGRSGLIAAAEEGALLVLGLSERWEREGIGETRWEVAQNTRVPVVFARRGLRPGGISPPESLTRFRWSATVGTR